MFTFSYKILNKLFKKSGLLDPHRYIYLDMKVIQDSANQSNLSFESTKAPENNHRKERNSVNSTF